MKKYDVVIIGAGIIGCSIAYRLSRYQASIAVLDREHDLANEVSMANSAIVHVGDDPADGTLKAQLNLRGATLYPELCEKLGVRMRKTGAYTVMVDPGQEEGFNELVRKCQQRSVRYEIISGDQARAQEPNLSDHVIKALSLPDTAVILPWEFAQAQLQVAVQNGTEVFLDTCVEGARKDDDGFILTTSQGEFSARYIINAAGTQSDIIASYSGETAYPLVLRKGEYFVLSHDAGDFVHRVIYPIPTAKGKGVLAVPTVDGNVLLGPDAVETTDRHGINNTREGLNIVREQSSTTLKNIPYNQIIRTFCGLRPSLSTKDFVIRTSPESEQWINLIGIDSPGIASAPGIAEYVEHLIQLPYPVKENWIDSRPAPFRFDQLSIEEKNAYIQQHPAYGHIVCRCEQISEGEIVAAIHEPLGARSVKGVKKRVRPGMGKCQGGFCEPLVVALLARELGIPEEQVLYDGPGSNIVFPKGGKR